MRMIFPASFFFLAFPFLLFPFPFSLLCWAGLESVVRDHRHAGLFFFLWGVMTDGFWVSFWLRYETNALDVRLDLLNNEIFFIHATYFVSLVRMGTTSLIRVVA